MNMYGQEQNHEHEQNQETCPYDPKKKRPTTEQLITESALEFVGLFTAIWVCAHLAKYFVGIDPLTIYYTVGLYCSAQATWWKYKAATDPTYKPYCKACAGGTNDSVTSARDNIFTVLTHEKGSLLFGVPNSFFGIFFYIFMMITNWYGLVYPFSVISPFSAFMVVRLLNITSCIGGLYLWYVMVNEIHAICLLCMTVHATNYVTLISLFF